MSDRHLLVAFAAAAALLAGWVAIDQVTDRPAQFDAARAAETRALAEAERAAAEAATIDIAVIGDSYTGGSDMGGKYPNGWTSHVAVAVEADGITARWAKEGAGGSGYVATGERDITFPELVPAVVGPGTDVLVVFGSRNDDAGTGIGDAAAATYGAARAIAPGVDLLVIGPPWVDGDVPDDLFANRDAVRGAADAAGAVFVDPLAEGWFTGDAETLIGVDGVHPTNDGHEYMAERIAPYLIEVAERRIAQVTG